MRQMVSRLVAIVVLLFIFTSTYAQISFGGLPRRSQSALRSQSVLPQYVTRAASTVIDTAVFSPSQFAYPFAATIDLKAEGVRRSIGDTAVSHSLMIISQGAQSINVIFSRCHLADGARLFVMSPRGGDIIGAFTADSNPSGGPFPTMPISCDTVIVTLEESIWDQDSEVIISQINHGFRATGIPLFMSSEECEVNALCHPTLLADQRRAVAQIMVNGTNFCTGTLLANAAHDTIPYILSAAHCLYDKRGNVDTTLARTCLFFFHYLSPSCVAKVRGSYERSVSSASVASFRKDGDMLLMRLSQMPPVDYMPYFAGWDLCENPSGPTHTLHHPYGDVMKVSTDDGDPDTCTFESFTKLFDDNVHWAVTQDEGITEGGSSGAALIDARGNVVGGLSGGSTSVSCAEPGKDQFFRLNANWSGFDADMSNLSLSLDPLGSGVSHVDGMEPYALPCTRLSNRGLAAEPDEAYDSDVQYLCGTNTIGISRVAEMFASSHTHSILHGVSFYPAIATYSESEPITMSVYSCRGGLPYEEIYSQTVKVTNCAYRQTSKAFQQQTQQNLTYKENYIRLSKPIAVADTFFVSFTTQIGAENAFALLHSTDADVRPSAYYLDSKGVWHSYQEYGKMSEVKHLMIDAVVSQEDPQAKVSDDRADVSLHVFPVPTSGEVSVVCGDEIDMIELVAIDGRVVKYESLAGSSRVATIDVSFAMPGTVYAIVVHTSNGAILTAKVVRR